ncbi:MAG: Trm112 family protein [Candidatus Aenigmatarchaeota archaeon]|nr:MAG: Trm112 family protein [Candidatus Aenigmarchaeota archaeon]
MPKSKLETLLEVLACPKCKGDVRHLKKESVLVCERCHLKYKILENDVPDMLIKDAEAY